MRHFALMMFNVNTARFEITNLYQSVTSALRGANAFLSGTEYQIVYLPRQYTEVHASRV